jgi:hypothetical protein
VTASTQQQRFRRRLSAAASAPSAEHPHDGRSGKGASNRNGQPHHYHFQRLAMPMRRRLQSVTHASQHTINQLKIREAVAKAFDGGKRFHKHFVVHDPSRNVLSGHQSTARAKREYRLLLIRRCVASEQFYASEQVA